VIFLMVPGPPFPSIISELLMCSGSILGKRVSISRQYALKSLAGATATANSFSKVMTPIVTRDFKRSQKGERFCWFAGCFFGAETRGREVVFIGWNWRLVAWKDRIHVSESSPKFFMCCSWSFIVLNNICTGQIKHLWNHIKLLIDYVYTLHHLFNKEKGNPSISISRKNTLRKGDLKT